MIRHSLRCTCAGGVMHRRSAASRDCISLTIKAIGRRRYYAGLWLDWRQTINLLFALLPAALRFECMLSAPETPCCYISGR
eukprot:6201251-Pleurochrysis_carterae.AAC.3